MVPSENCDSIAKPDLQRHNIFKEKCKNTTLSLPQFQIHIPVVTDIYASIIGIVSLPKILYLKRNQKRNCLDRIVASVDIVSHEEIVGVWRLPPNLKQLHQVMKLTMDISADCHRTSHLLHVGLLCKDLLCLKWGTKKTHDDAD